MYSVSLSLSLPLCLFVVSDAVGNLSCSGVSWDSVQLSWDLPSNPNGQIIYYEILVEMDLQSHTHRTNSSEYMMTGLSPDQEYTLTVAAVNSAGPGDRINCTASTLSESGKPSLAFFFPVHPGTPGYLVEAIALGFNESLI